MGSDGPVYWDSFPYVTQALTGEIGGLGLGRPVFAIVSQWVADGWLAVGGSVWDLEPVLRWWWAAVTALSAPMTIALAREVGLSTPGARLAGMLVASSPALAHAGFAVLTDGPALPMVLAAVWYALKVRTDGRVVDAVWVGLWLGFAVGIREAALVTGLIVLSASGVQTWLHWRRFFAAIITAALVIGLPMAWAAYSTPWYGESITSWMAGLDHDRHLQRWGLFEIGMLTAWVFSLNPFGVLVAGAASWRPGTMPPQVRRLWWPALVVLLLMCTYHSATYSPRYLLIAFPMAVAIPAAWWLERRLLTTSLRRSVVVAVLMCQVPAATLLIRWNDAPLLAVAGSMPGIVTELPADSVIVTGLACPAVPMIREQHNRASSDAGGGMAAWEAVCPGWSWPADADGAFEEVLARGQLLVLDLRAEAWRGDEQLRALDQVRAFAARGLPGVRLIE
jgi:hypothetical protein